MWRRIGAPLTDHHATVNLDTDSRYQEVQCRRLPHHRDIINIGRLTKVVSNRDNRPRVSVIVPESSRTLVIYQRQLAIKMEAFHAASCGPYDG